MDVYEMKIIAINGGKHSRKDALAMKLSENSDCVWINPFTDKKVPFDEDMNEYDSHNHMSEDNLSDMIERREVLALIELDGSRYVFFKEQFSADYVVILADDRILEYLKKNWNGKMVTVRCRSKDEVESDRCQLPDKEYDYIFNYDSDDYDTLEALVV